MAWSDKARQAAAAARKAKARSRDYFKAQDKANKPMNSAQAKRLIAKRDAASKRMSSAQSSYSSFLSRATRGKTNISGSRKARSMYDAMFKSSPIKRI